MADMKRPFHEVLAEKLEASRTPLLRNPSSALAAEIRTILDVLLKGKMPAAAAHQIASDQGGLPVLLTSVGEGHLSRFAEEVLEDLFGRTDERQVEVDEAPTFFRL